MLSNNLHSVFQPQVLHVPPETLFDHLTGKVLHLNQLTSVIRTASIFAGNNPSIKEIKRILDETLRRHEIML